jgi:hypothetical protein
VSGKPFRPEMVNTGWILSRHASQSDMDRNSIWMVNHSWMIRSQSQEINHGRGMTIMLHPFIEDIKVMRRYTLLDISYFDFKLQSYN